MSGRHLPTAATPVFLASVAAGAAGVADGEHPSHHRCCHHPLAKQAAVERPSWSRVSDGSSLGEEEASVVGER